MRIICFYILTIMLGGIFGCQASSQDKSQTNQINQNSQNNKSVQKDAAAKTEPLKLRLNNEDAGTTENTSALSEKLETIFKNREKEGAFRPETNEIEKSVYLAADRSVSAEEIAKLFAVLKDSGASPILIPVRVKVTNLKPNPLMLYVSVGSGDHSPPVNEIKEIDLDGANTEKEETFDDIKGVEIGFIGESSDDISVAVSKDGTYTMEGKLISAGDLKTAIENSFKAKDKSEKTIFVQAENYGNMEDIAAIGASAGVFKVYFITKNIE